MTGVFSSTQMNSSPNTILAIAPGTRELGIAIFIGGNLAYVSVKTITNRNSKEFLLKEIGSILQKLFQSFSIGIVIAKAISQYQQLSPDLEQILVYIKSETIRKGLQLIEISLEQIKSVLCKSEKPTEKEAFEALLSTYPELERYWNRPNKWQDDYYAFLFSAVAVGEVYLKALTEND